MRTRPWASEVRKVSERAIAALGAVRRWPAEVRTLSDKPLRRLAQAVPLDADDRSVAAMLLLPFFLMAFAIATNQSLKPDTIRYLALPSPAAAPSAVSRQLAARPRSIAETVQRLPATVPLSPSQEAVPNQAAATVNLGAPVVGARSLPIEIYPAIVEELAPGPAATAPAPVAPNPVELKPLASDPQLAPAGPPTAVPSVAVASALRLAPPPAQIAALDPPPALVARPFASTASEDAVCRPDARPVSMVAPSPAVWRPGDGADWSRFGNQLAEAASQQLGKLVIYNDAYRRISYPMGDVPALFGVCTDVIIRAYRALGIDLQAEVQQARLGSGDSSIDHRRTSTLRRLFTRHGESLPVSAFAEDYLPGDIVTYHRPQNRRSRSHIAIVSDRVGPSGRPMIIHNRGWGPQLEDALFADRITGHYRYGGIAPRQPLYTLTTIDGAADRTTTGYSRQSPPLLKASLAPVTGHKPTTVSRRH